MHWLQNQVLDGEKPSNIESYVYLKVRYVGISVL
jgi:hypothetical protein